MFNVLSVLTPDVSLHRCSPTSSPMVWLILGSLLTSVLPVFIHIKSCTVDCLLPISLNSLWFCSFPSCLILSFLERQTLLSQEFYGTSCSQLFMKNKDVRDGPLQNPSLHLELALTHSQVHCSEQGKFTNGTGFITIYICEGRGWPTLFSCKNTVKSDHLDRVLYRDSPL